MPTFGPLDMSYFSSNGDAGELLLGSPQWAMPGLLIGLVLAAIVIFNYTTGRAAGPVRLLAASLKLAAIGLVILCLVEPLQTGTRPRPHANVLPILVDNSQSMQVKPIGAKRTRGQVVAKLADDGANWKVRLAQTFDVRTYAFDTRLQKIDSPDKLTMDGYVSSLAGSLTSLKERFGNRPVGGVVLMTDGNLTDPPSADFDWSKLGFPVYPVLPAEDAEVRDLRIADVSVRQTDFESAPMTVRVSTRSEGMDGQEVLVQLRDLATGKLVEQQVASVTADGQASETSFRFRPRNRGFNSIRSPR